MSDADSVQPGLDASVAPTAFEANPQDAVKKISRWGIGDFFMGLPFVLTILVNPIFLLIAIFSGGWNDTELASETSPPINIAFLAIAMLIQQGLTIAWPLIVSRWKGLGPAKDWGLSFKPYDPLIALALMVAVYPALSIFSAIVTQLVGLEQDAAASNSQFLTDAKGSPWLIVLIFGVVILAPLTEEIYFRGFVQRVFDRRFGNVTAIAVSSTLFTITHGAENLKGTVVLFSVIGALGLIFAIIAAKTNRLGIPIICHVYFNAFGVAGALGWLPFLE